MMGTFFIFFMIAVFLLLVLAYLVRTTETGKGIGKRCWHWLVYAWMKIEIAWAYGMEYVNLTLSNIFKGYQYNSMRSEAVRRKEQRLREFHESRRDFNRKPKDTYYRKIPR